MPKSKPKSKKFNLARLIKTKDHFSWRKLTAFALGFGVVGTGLARLSFAYAPVTCYYNSCGTTHTLGNVTNSVWPNSWYSRGGGSAGTMVWRTSFPAAAGHSSAPSGTVFQGCTRLFMQYGGQVSMQMNVRYLGGDQGTGNSLTWSQLKDRMQAKTDGSSLQASGSDWVQGIWCMNLKGPAANYTDPLITVRASGSATSPVVIINYVQMKRL